MNINKNIAISETGFVFNPGTGDSFSVNQVGKEVLRLLQAGSNREDILDNIREKFSVDRATLDKDLEDFYLMLKSYQILKDDEQA